MVSPQNALVPAEMRAGRRFSLARLAPLALIAALAILVLAMGWHRELSLEALVRHRAALDAFIAAHFVAALAGFVAIYVAAVALSLPGALLLTISGGVLFGWLVGALAAVAGATVGATLVFLIARSALGDYVRRKAGARVTKLAEGFKADAFNYLLFLRLVPVFPFFLVNLAPALLGVRLGTFVAATALGILPATFAYAFVGSGLDSVIAAQEAAYNACLAAGGADCRLDFNVRQAVTVELVVALTALGVLALTPVLMRRRRARATSPPYPPAQAREGREEVSAG
jgi:uncharacterized membrane protein YdjX (TVP38/TMEM64 family)